MSTCTMYIIKRIRLTVNVFADAANPSQAQIEGLLRSA